MEIVNRIGYQVFPIKRGYTDHILDINLSTREAEVINVSPEFRERFIGGRGYALKLIWDRTNENTRYNSEDNILVMASGPLGNEPKFPGTGKFIVGTISPLTDTFIDSNVGGHFGPLLKRCGFDAMIISGISFDELIIIIDGDNGIITIATAPCFDADIDISSIGYGEALLRSLFNEQELAYTALVTCGIGAENTRFGIINSLFYDRKRKRIRAKQAGRGGTGTAMRAKGIRAVVVHSSLPDINSNRPANPEDVKRAGAELKKVLSKMDPKQLKLGLWGTPVLVEYMNKFHILPVNNYQYGSHEEASKVFSEIFLKQYFEKGYPDGCYKGCNLACAKASKEISITRGPWKGKKVAVDGPEYETIGAVTSMGIFDPQFIMEYNWYCDQYGLDTISMGVSASFLMECFQRGYLSDDDVNYSLNWGDIESANRLLHETAMGKGFGRICGMGVRRAKLWVAERYSKRKGIPIDDVVKELDRFAMEVKGLEFSMYISKESLAQQGGYGFALKGPQHDEAWLIFIDQVYNEIPTFEMKAKALKWFPLIRTWFNAVGLCKLPWIDVRHPEAINTEDPSHNLPTLQYYVRYFNATVGTNKSLDDILTDSERLYTLQKLLNLRNGKGSRKDDMIPLRAMGPAFVNEYLARESYYDAWLREVKKTTVLPQDLNERHAILMSFRKEAYEKLCDTVYKEKGYSREGVPLAETVERLGLLDDKVMKILKLNGIDMDYELVSN